jgi:hypothetical protein
MRMAAADAGFDLNGFGWGIHRVTGTKYNADGYDAFDIHKSVRRQIRKHG